MILQSSDARRARPLLGTIVEIAASGLQANEAIEAAFKKISDIHHLMSFHEVDSDVTRINRLKPGTPLLINPMTYEVIEFAQKLSISSQGYFDITVGSVLTSLELLPLMGNICSSNYSSVSFHDFELLHDNFISVKKPLCIDLGGIAKGYAVDMAIATLKDFDLFAGKINAGGDLRFFGTTEDVFIPNPFDSSKILKLSSLADCSVATSSDYYNTGSIIDENAQSPLVNTKLARNQRWDQSITVITDSCMKADALTKIIALAPTLRQPILVEYKAQAITIDKTGINFIPTPNNLN